MNQTVRVEPLAHLQFVCRRPVLFFRYTGKVAQPLSHLQGLYDVSHFDLQRDIYYPEHGQKHKRQTLTNIDLFRVHAVYCMHEDLQLISPANGLHPATSLVAAQ